MIILKYGKDTIFESDKFLETSSAADKKVYRVTFLVNIKKRIQGAEYSRQQRILFLEASSR